ncbi:hypothetical protein BUALT_Bualt11G0014500 [Buddleja alternifolia]|uniref:FLZ-type domain-containing protein n=1 Tax=Buddleja alternifolia TaxID=168488 RepID=A0AAV6X2C9_9LAMI|nr:hypothetical protein BUALT_Bualt11G0014500 [Buddleja alternifolia]
MMLGMRGRPPRRRTTSMEVAPLPPLGMIGGEFSGYDHMKNSWGDSYVEMADFLRSCSLCNRRLAPDRDIYMYRGDRAFCSVECREQQMKHDEIKERHAAAVAKKSESHHQEQAAAVPEAETVAAA